MGRAFGTAMTGRSKGLQDLADKKIPLTVTLSVVACRGAKVYCETCLNHLVIQ
jgi:hypothetical protein